MFFTINQITQDTNLYFLQDCNGDGKLDCDDFAAIHVLGGYGCRGVPLPNDYLARYQQCKTIIGNLRP